MKTGELWPVYKGASFNLWQPDTGKYVTKTSPGIALDWLQEKRHNQANYKSSPFYGADLDWLAYPDTLPCFSPRVAYRATTRATDSRTCIACLVPPKVLIVNSAPYLFFPPGNQKLEAYYLGVMSSIPLDWYTRRVVELSLTVAIYNECPFPNPPVDDPLRLKVVELAGRLAAVDERYAEWAEAVGVPVSSANSDPVKSELIAELDAAVALLYGLDEDDLRKIWDTFYLAPVRVDRRSNLDKVLSHHRNLQG